MGLDKSAIQFEDDYPTLAHISAQAGLPFMSAGGSGGESRIPPMNGPRMADIVVGGRGGGAESAPYDGASTGDH